ncbi:MAG: hypothetical protein KF901_33625 [Myxococcales bacterium]|nr:hypothetical protein [Myxococcales bacterium]
MTHRPRLLTLALLSSLLASPASASPWTLRQGEIAITAAYDQQWASREYLDARGRDQPFSLNGSYRGSTVGLGIRAGFTDRLELEVQIPFKLVSYTADPVILIAAPEGAEGLDHYQDNVIDLSRAVQGVGDIRLYGRYNLLRWPLAVAIEGRLKAPAGYDRPAGTFGERPRNAQDFLDNIGTFVRPENVRDDVTLGDGQLDLGLSLLLGLSLPSRTFMRLDLGYDLRFGAGDQLLGSFKIGQLFGPRFLAYADLRVAYAWQRGRVIGVSVAAIDPTLPATEYGGLTNLFLREVTLDRDEMVMALGGIVRITETVEINLGYQRTLWGRNTALVQGVYVTLGVRTRLQQFEPAPEPTADVEVDAAPEPEYAVEPASAQPSDPGPAAANEPDDLPDLDD